MTSGEKRSKQIDALMEQASVALEATEYFKAESLASQALAAARQAADFDRMARIILPLQEARRQRFQLALDAGPITILDASVDEDTTVKAGCYLVRPPQVGADARRLRLIGLEHRIPVTVVCREPLTQLGDCPVVAIAPGVTVRTRIDPPDDPDDPGMAWFVGALEQLGDWAIDGLDPDMAVLKRIDALMLRLEALPEHERLHQALADACRRAQRERAEVESGD